MKNTHSPDQDGEPSLIPSWLPGCLAFFAWATLLLALTKPWIPLNDQATGRQLVSGAIIFEEGGIPSHTPLSYFHMDREYMNLEWLFDALLWSGFKLGGVSTLAYVSFAFFTVTLCLLFQFLLKNGVSLPVAFGGTVLMAMANYVHLLARPVILTYFLLTSVVILWISALNGKTGKIHWILFPLIFVFWANIHPGFVPALIFMGLSLAGAMWDGRKKPWGRFKKPAALIFLSAALTLVNPFGWKLHLVVLDQVLHKKALAQVQEFLPPDFAHPNGAVLALAFVLMSGFLLGLRPGNRLRAQEVLPALFFLYFAMRVQRHILIFLPIVLLPFALTWDQWLASFMPAGWKERFRTHTSIALNARYEWAWIFSGILAAGLLFHLLYGSSLRIGADTLTPRAETFIRENIEKFKRPLTSSVQAGNLLFYFYPRLRVSFDDRADFYTDEESFAYIDQVNMRKNWRELLAQNSYDSALLYISDPLAEGLQFEKGWKKIYEDSGLVIFEKDPNP